MAEWSNAAVLKTVDLYTRIRGFESLFLRITNYSLGNAGGFLFCRYPNQTCYIVRVSVSAIFFTYPVVDDYS
jgi:hypothetical protein